jgi:hypothetical protein
LAISSAAELPGGVTRLSNVAKSTGLVMSTTIRPVSWSASLPTISATAA